MFLWILLQHLDMDTGAKKKQADTYSNSFGSSPPLPLLFLISIVYMICYFFDNDGMHYNNTMDYIILRSSSSSSKSRSLLIIVLSWLETRDNIFLVNRQNLSQCHHFLYSYYSTPLSIVMQITTKPQKKIK